MRNICNINLIWNRVGEPLSDRAIDCIEVMGYMSSDHNKDGAGAIYQHCNNAIFVSHTTDKIRIRRGMNYTAIATHQRLSTSGHSADNLHPYKRKDFLLMHNGIFQDLGNKRHSDSSEYADKIQAEMTAGADLVEAIKRVHTKVSGSYSVLIYELGLRRWIYYKNSSPNITMVEHPKYLLMSTDSDNVKFATWFLDLDDKLCRELKVEPNKIYDLGTLQELGDIEEKAWVWPATKTYNKDDWDSKKDTSYGGYYLDRKSDTWRKIPGDAKGEVSRDDFGWYDRGY